MSRVLFVLCAVLAAASAFDWTILTPEKKAALAEKVRKVKDKCLHGTNYTQEQIHEEMHKPPQEINKDMGCIIKCFMQNGPQAMDESGKIVVPQWFPEVMRKDVEECAKKLEEEKIEDLCEKALQFKIQCVIPHHKHDHEHEHDHDHDHDHEHEH